MSTTMLPMLELCNAAPARSTEHDAMAHVAQTAVRSPLTQVPALRSEAESSSQNISHPDACTVQAPRYNFAYGAMSDGKAKPSPQAPSEPPPSQGFELLGKDDAPLAWFACVLDACDGLKAHRGPGKVVRCADRALMKIRHPHKGRP